MKRSQTVQGFILVAVLWVLAAITVAAGFFNLWTQRSLDTVLHGQQAIAAQIDLKNTASTLIFLLTTQPRTPAGFKLLSNTLGGGTELTVKAPTDPFGAIDYQALPGEDVRMDGTLYPGCGDAYFALQDTNGLLNILRDNGRMTHLLINLGVAPEQTQALMAKLLDYTDPDNLSRLNGAEQYQYQQQDRLPPTNYPLRTPQEALRVLGWREQTGLWQQQALFRLTYLYGGLPNFNTAPLEVLRVLPELTAEEAQRIVQQRTGVYIESVSDLYQILGRMLPWDDLDLSLYPSKIVRIMLVSANSPGVTYLTFGGAVQQATPWYLDNVLQFPQMASTHLESPNSLSLFCKNAGM